LRVAWDTVNIIFFVFFEEKIKLKSTCRYSLPPYINLRTTNNTMARNTTTTTTTQSNDGKGNNPSTPVMYLAHEDWSPRFENTFYTVRIDSFELYTSTLPSTATNIGGKTSLPAYYYKITVFSGHQRRTVLRRYSQFEWLYRNLPPSITHYDEPLQLPPKTPCQFFCQNQNDSFAQNRMEQLQDFLRDVLIRRGAADHDTVAQFLELEALAFAS
jgi:PX domain